MGDKKGLFGGLFGAKKSGCNCNMESEEKKEDESCCCGSACTTENRTTDKDIVNGRLDIKILGPGCKNCVTLEENTKFAVEQMGLNASIKKVTDMAEIAGYGIMSTPGLLVNDKVVSYGKVLKPDDIIKLLEKTM